MEPYGKRYRSVLMDQVKGVTDEPAKNEDPGCEDCHDALAEQGGDENQVQRDRSNEGIYAPL
jgi:hypothetical protein